jgi:hypothetical protein
MTDTMAIVAVEIDGEGKCIEESVVYLRELGVKVEEIGESDSHDLPQT